jgi:hypothetical protein
VNNEKPSKRDVQDKQMEFYRLCDNDPEKALFDAAKSVVGNHYEMSGTQTDWDKEHAKWAGEHGIWNLALAVESYMKRK